MLIERIKREFCMQQKTSSCKRIARCMQMDKTNTIFTTAGAANGATAPEAGTYFKPGGFIQ